MHGLVKKYVMRLPFCGQRFYCTMYPLYKQVAVIPMGTNCALLVADLFMFFFYERNFIMPLSDDKQADIIDAFKHYIMSFE